MRADRVGCGIVGVVVLLVGCGDGASRLVVDGGGGGPERDGAAGGRDAGLGGGADSGGMGLDAGPDFDGGPAVDAGPPAPEVCTGGLDEDGDTQTDCADDDCWLFDACIAADVARMVPSLVVCGDPLEVDATASAAACEMLGMPSMSTYPTECAAGSLQATGHVFCDASGAPAALWIEERLDAPRTSRMITMRRFELTNYERESVVDFEKVQDGFGERTGGSGFPIHERQDYAAADTTRFRVITVRPVMSGNVVSRLLGMTLITSIVDLDLPMSMDTRHTLRTGGLRMVVPAP